jgi:hypothetical protein
MQERYLHRGEKLICIVGPTYYGRNPEQVWRRPKLVADVVGMKRIRRHVAYFAPVIGTQHPL